MKRTIIAALAAITLSIGITATNAAAFTYGGPWMGGGYTMSNAGYNSGNNTQLQVNTNELRLAITKARVELNALVATPGYDVTRVTALANEIATNQLALDQISQNYGSGVASYNMMGPAMMNRGYWCW